jgi:hypothetical protein
MGMGCGFCSAELESFLPQSHGQVATSSAWRADLARPSSEVGPVDFLAVILRLDMILPFD